MEVAYRVRNSPPETPSRFPLKGDAFVKFAGIHSQLTASISQVMDFHKTLRKYMSVFS